MMSKISEVSKRTGLSKRTLQYYDDEGLLHVPRNRFLPKQIFVRFKRI